MKLWRNNRLLEDTVRDLKREAAISKLETNEVFSFHLVYRYKSKVR